MTNQKQITFKLQKVLAGAMGISRRSAEKLIEKGKVIVNGQIAHIGQRVDLTVDRIKVGGLSIGGHKKLEYFLLYKPRGYVTSKIAKKGQTSVMELLPPTKKHLFPVGRLDIESEGLLLMTNDGQLAYQLTHPKFRVEKTYHVYPDRHITRRAFSHIKRGSLIRGKMIVPVKINRLEDDGISITLTSGQKHVVRKILARAGYETVKLVRVKMGKFELGDLNPGQFKEVF